MVGSALALVAVLLQAPGVLLATTTSTRDTGLLDSLLPLFERRTGSRVKVVAVGSGQALEMGRRGDADVVLSHAPDAERVLADSGYFRSRRRVMHNDFIIVGPPGDPAALRGATGAAAALARLPGSRATFISRGDRSGTHQLELALWRRAGVTPPGTPAAWYVESGQGMAATLQMADQKRAYTLTDRGTFLAWRAKLQLEPVVEGDPALYNVYHVMDVTPRGRALADFFVSREAQALIGSFGAARFGRPLFVPDAAQEPSGDFSGPPGSAEPNLARTADGGAVLTWLEPAGEKRSAFRFAVRTAGRWSEPRTIVQGDSFFVNWADFPSLVVLPSGAWIAHWLARVPGGVYAYHVRLAISTDRGTTWSRPITAHRDRTAQEHGFVSMVPWDDSTAALVWLDGRDMKPGPTPSHEGEGDMTLRFATVSSGGRLGEEVLLDARTCECCQTALARTAGGLVAAYRDRSPEEIRDIAVVRRVGGGWTPPVRVAADNWHYPGCPVNGPALSARGDTVAIAWFTAPGGTARVQAAFSLDGGATWGSPIQVDDGRPIGRVDVELVTGGALVTWLESAGAQAEVRARRVPLRGRPERSTLVSVSSTARSSGFPRTLVAGGEVIFAWTSAQGIRVTAQPVDR